MITRLLIPLAALALAGYAALGVARDPQWLRMLIWFGAAIVAHDLVAYPMYALVDRALARLGGVVNYVRIPLLASALTFVLFLPGIVRQGADAYRAATGMTQEPFLARWLVLCAVFFAVAALAYAVRLARTRLR